MEAISDKVHDLLLHELDRLAATTPDEARTSTVLRDGLLHALTDVEHDQACRIVFDMLGLMVWPPKRPASQPNNVVPIIELQKQKAAVDALCKIANEGIPGSARPAGATEQVEDAGYRASDALLDQTKH